MDIEEIKSIYLQRLEDNVDQFLETLEGDPANAMTSSYFFAQNIDIHKQFLTEIGFEVTNESLDTLLKLIQRPNRSR